MKHVYARIVPQHVEHVTAGRLAFVSLALTLLVGFSMQAPERQAPDVSEVSFQLAPAPQPPEAAAAPAASSPRKPSKKTGPSKAAAAAAKSEAQSAIPLPEAPTEVLSAEETEEPAVTGEAEDAPSGDVAEGGATGAEASNGLGKGEGGGDGAGMAGNGPGGDGTGLLASIPRPRSWMWSCDWPFFPSSNDATVHVRVTVDKDGDATRVEVESFTHKDFVSVAHECAKRSHYHPARLKDGTTTAGVTEVLPIHFIRSGAQ